MQVVITNVKLLPSMLGTEARLLSPPFPGRKVGEKVEELLLPSGNRVIIDIVRREGEVPLGERERVLALNSQWLKPFIGMVKASSGVVYPSPLLRALLMDYWWWMREGVPSFNETISKLKSRINLLERRLDEERRVTNNALEIAMTVRNLSSLISNIREGSEQLLSTASEIQVLLLRVEELKMMMQRNTETILSELRSLKEELAEARRRLDVGDLRGVREALERVEERVERVEEGLPSWASDNPWLELIAKSRKNL